MKKLCKYCNKEIKGKAKNYDYYYFCNNIDCLDKYLNEPESKIIILAGSREEFDRHLDAYGLTDSEAIYGYCADRIYGIKARDVHTIGTFWSRKDATKLKELADSRKIK
jgi:hypothetical protein